MYKRQEHASEEEVRRVCKLAQADGFVSEFPDGYDTMIVQGGNNVSGGQKQRLCLSLIHIYQRDISGIEEKVISLYARGMSTRDIHDQLQDCLLYTSRCV